MSGTAELAIDAAFAARLFDELAARTGDAPGITRAAYGEGEQIAHDMMIREAQALGLTHRIDPAGNLYLTYEGRDPALKPWVVGSHLDSVPHGGNFDGAAGVIAGLCAVRALIEAGLRPRRSITVMAIRAEESNWFPLSYLGSRAALGLLPAESLSTPRSDTGLSLRAHMSRLGLDPARVGVGQVHLDPAELHGFIELHIEQGPVLEAAQVPVGFVTGIAGSFRYRAARILGEWGHSGAVPRGHRHDAVFALADLITALDRLWGEVLEGGESATITFGEIGTDPALHGFSKVPGEAGFCLDVRSPSPACLERIHAGLLHIVAGIEAARGVRFNLGARSGSAPARLDEALRARLAAVAEGCGAGFTELASGAGHDTAVFANAGVPAALVFLRNQNGSHNPDEAMEMADFAVGADILARLLARDDND
ncbi:Zn-dependent hydrolase [Ancylobacter pratisalsi]|uniref:Hydantoinase/carbamoylase family amidase n=1 Tax=Ancylobacter pratisalsi TaxID=1745854 RepID=A0A6P1YJL5_9HYPH|nr:Zn-dependent hydrolase [Ancylobacter pratisalsi]QIB33577.1 hydantoinase/carbamoylase family amidase [Ancylobacter pratisalsi]